MYEAAMSQNLMMNFGGSTPAQALFGYTPRDYYDPSSDSIVSYKGALENSPDPYETTLRLRMMAKANVTRAVIEDRIARANHSKPHRVAVGELATMDLE